MRQRSQVCCLREHDHTVDFPYNACLNVTISWSYDPDKCVTRGHTYAPLKMWETPAIQPPIGIFCSAINGCIFTEGIHQAERTCMQNYFIPVKLKVVVKGGCGWGLAKFATWKAVNSGCYFYMSKLIRSHLQSWWPYLRCSLNALRAGDSLHVENGTFSIYSPQNLAHASFNFFFLVENYPTQHKNEEATKV